MRKFVLAVFSLVLGCGFIETQSQTIKLSDAEKAVLQIAVRKPDGTVVGFGTGFFVRDDGLIATAFHVYSQAVQVASESRGGILMVRRATRQSGTTTVANVIPVATDEAHDLILLKLVNKDDGSWAKVGGIRVLSPCTMVELDTGIPVRVVGYFGGDIFPISLGAKLVGETAFTVFPGTDVGEFLVSAAAVPGHSGSPVILDEGCVVGVVLSIVTFSVPFNSQPLASGLNRVAKGENLQRLVASLPK